MRYYDQFYFDIFQEKMLMCGKVTHKNLIDNRPLFRYYSSIWIEKTSLIQYNKVSGRYLYEVKNTNRNLHLQFAISIFSDFSETIPLYSLFFSY